VAVTITAPAEKDPGLVTNWRIETMPRVDSKPTEVPDVLSLNVSGRDQIAYKRADDVVSEYALGPDSLLQPDVPAGEVTSFRWVSDRVYPGVERAVSVYVPADLPRGKASNLIVFQDGSDYLDAEFGATAVLDNLIHRDEIPPTVALFVDAGETGPGYPLFGGTDNRSTEYDSVNGDYGRFLIEELLPEVRTLAPITDDPRGRAVCGISSGGACAFTVAWHHPDEFANVISHCGSFLGIRGANEYPVLIRQNPRKNLRVWHQTGERDVDVIFGNIPLANRELDAALRYRHYDSLFEFGTGGHSLRHGAAVFPETLRWIWREHFHSRSSR
jgi:enterochelin esterase-like enzyme